MGHNRADGPNVHHNMRPPPPSEPASIINAHGGTNRVKRKARGCFLLVNIATERLLVVTLNLLNYVLIKGGRQKQAISRWRRLSH